MGEAELVDDAGDDDRRLGDLRVRADRVQHRPAVHARHLDVEQDRPGLQGAGERQAGAPVIGRAHPEPFALEEALEQVAGGRVVVDEQHHVVQVRLAVGDLLDAGGDAFRLHLLLVGVDLGGQADREGRALAEGALDADRAAHALDEGAGDGEPEAGAAELARGRFVGLREALEQPADLLLGQADAGIGDGKAQPVGPVLPFAPHRERDLALFREFGRVADQVDQRLAQLQLILMHRAQIAVVVEAEAVALLRDQALRRGGDVLDQRRHVEGLGRQRQAAGLDLGDVEHVVDEAEQVAGGRLDLAQVGQQLGLAQILQLLAEHLGVPDHRGERRAQLVAHIGQELAFREVGGLGGRARPLDLGLRLLARGDVDVEPDPFADRAVLGEHGHAAHLHVAPDAVVAAQAVLDLEDPHPLDAFGPDLGDPRPVVGMDHVDPAPPLIGLVALAGIGGPARLGRHQLALRGRAPDHGRRGIDQRAEALLGMAERVLGEARLGDIGVGAVPAHDGAVRAADRLGHRQEPAVPAVPAPQGEGVLPRLARRDAGGKTLGRALQVIGVVQLAPAVIGHLGGRGAGVVVPAAIVPDEVAVGLRDPGELGQRVGEVAEIRHGRPGGRHLPVLYGHGDVSRHGKVDGKVDGIVVMAIRPTGVAGFRADAKSKVSGAGGCRGRSRTAPSARCPPLPEARPAGW